MKITIDRFEKNFAVCETEDKKMINIEKSKLPKNSREGDVLNFLNGKYITDKKETEKKREENFDLLNKLLNR